MKTGTQKKSDSNRRRRPRIDEIQKVRFKVLVAQEGEGFLQNLSEDGGCLMLNETFEPGTLLQLELSDLDGNPHLIRVICRVVWQSGYLTGVKFLNE